MFENLTEQRAEENRMREKHSILVKFLCFGSVGAIVSLAFLYLSTFPRSSFGRRVLREILYPAILASDDIIRTMFSHNRIGPSHAEVVTFNVIFVALCTFATGALGLIVQLAFRSVRRV